MKSFFTHFKKGMVSFGHDISTVVNTLLLLVVYVVGVGITSLVAKLSKKEFLEMKTSKEKKSYWSDLNLKKKDLDEYYSQF